VDTSSKKPQLKVAFVSNEGAKYACLNWHYSKSMPCGKIVKLGAWEDGVFIGAVLFARGANNNIGKPYNLEQTQCIELVRVALRAHKTPVSKIMSIAITLLKKQSPRIQLIVSYADPDKGHHGGVYQAMNWIYRGLTNTQRMFFHAGKWTHKRTLSHIPIEKRRLLPVKNSEGKHTYIYPLNKSMRAKIAALAKPYPKKIMRTKWQESENPSDLGSSTLTCTLHSLKVDTHA